MNSQFEIFKFKSLSFLLIWNFIIWSIMQEKVNTVLEVDEKSDMFAEASR